MNKCKCGCDIEVTKEGNSYLKGHNKHGRPTNNVEWFIKKAIEKHGNFYDYSEVKYVNTTTKIEIICSIHGKFIQAPVDHIRGSGCTKCGI